MQLPTHLHGQNRRPTSTGAAASHMNPRERVQLPGRQGLEQHLCSRLEVMCKVCTHLGEVGLLAAAQCTLGGSKIIETVVQTYCSSNRGIRDGLQERNNTARVPHDSRRRAHSSSLWACSRGPGRGSTASPPFKSEPCIVYQASARNDVVGSVPFTSLIAAWANDHCPTQCPFLNLLSCTIVLSHLREKLRHTAPDQSSSAAQQSLSCTAALVCIYTL